MTKTNFLIVAIAALIFPVSGWGQADVSPLDGYTPGQVMQGSPAGAIPISGFEVFNPANGQISLNIPLLTVGGRGAVRVPLVVPLTSAIFETLAVQYPYNCGQYTPCSYGYGYVVQTTGWNPLPASLGQGGSMVARGSGNYCGSSSWNQTLTRLTFSAPDGTQTEFVDKATNGALENPGYNRGTAFVADNGTNALFTASSAVVDPTGCSVTSTAESGTMTMANGMVYTLANGLVTQVEDTNGNITKFAATTVTDNLGRAYTTSTGSDGNGNYEQLSYQGYNNTQRIYKVRYDWLHNHLKSGQTETYGQLWPGVPGPPTSGGPSNLSTTFDPNDIISEIDLPDGTSYQFLYDAYANVVQITLPQGGVIQYTYGTTTNASGGTPQTYMLSSTPASRSQLLGGTVVSKMTFPGSGEIDRYDGSGNLLAKETHSIVNGGTLPSYATNYNSWQYDQSGTDTYYDSAANGGGVLLSQTTSYFHDANCNVNCGTAQTVTTTMGSAVKQTSYSYDGYGNVEEQKDWDWGSGGPGSVLRDTKITYTTSSTYTNANMVSLPVETQVLDGSGNLFGDVKMGYDVPGISGSNGTSVTLATLNGTYHATSITAGTVCAGT